MNILELPCTVSCFQTLLAGERIGSRAYFHINMTRKVWVLSTSFHLQARFQLSSLTQVHLLSFILCSEAALLLTLPHFSTRANTEQKGSCTIPPPLQTSINFPISFCLLALQGFSQLLLAPSLSFPSHSLLLCRSRMLFV